MEKKIESIKRRFFIDLVELSLSYVVSKWILDRTPFIFRNSNSACILWKEQLAAKIGVDSHAMSIVGSAGLGFSLNPYKNFKSFDDNSDIDIAIISHHYFEVSWRYLRTLGTKRYKLDVRQKAALADHKDRLIYWGTIATDRLLPIFPYSREWSDALDEMATVEPTIDRGIKIRIYKDFESLRAYNVSNLTNIRDNILNPMKDDQDEAIPEYNA